MHLIQKVMKRVEELETAIKKVVSRRADDLCWRDVYAELASLVNVEFRPELISRDAFLANCEAFECSMRTGGLYKPVYVEMSSEDVDRIYMAGFAAGFDMVGQYDTMAAAGLAEFKSQLTRSYPRPKSLDDQSVNTK